ncbi:MAG: SRPBCC domain-containing protein [Actinomycetota bacterium]
MRRAPDPIAAVRKERAVPLPPERAFELFTTRMGSWWPMLTHSLAGDGATGVRFEGHVGGRVVELTADGVEHVWAVVTTWDPPERLVLSWHPAEEPEAASRVEVRFVATDTGCQLELEHTDFEEHGEIGRQLRDRYDPGWDEVLVALDRATVST